MLITHGDVEINPGPNTRANNLAATKEDINDLKKHMSEILKGITTLNNKWEAFENRITELESKLDQQGVVVTENTKQIAELNNTLSNLKEKELVETNKTMQVRADEAEDRSRRNNLIFSGISESDGEKWNETESKLYQKYPPCNGSCKRREGPPTW